MKTCACGKAISAQSKTGRCAPCANADPAVRAKKGQLTPEQKAARSESMRRLNADRAVVERRTKTMLARMDDPAARAHHAQACRASKADRMKDPAFRAKLVEAGKRVGARNFHHAHTPEAREKARRSIQLARMAWCPEELWPLNETLKRKGYRLAERKSIILADVEGTPEHARRVVENHKFASELRHARDLAQRY